MIERLLVLLRDPDYRVRFSLARQIGVLFQTWDGHVELFQDIWWVIPQFLVPGFVLHDKSWLLFIHKQTCSKTLNDQLRY